MSGTGDRRRKGPLAVLRPLQRFANRHPVLDAMMLGPIVLFALLVFRGLGLDLSLAWCFIIAAIATGLGALVGLRNRRLLRQRRQRGKPAPAALRYLGLADPDEGRPPLSWRVGLPIIGFIVFVTAGGLGAMALIEP